MTSKRYRAARRVTGRMPRLAWLMATTTLVTLQAPWPVFAETDSDRQTVPQQGHLDSAQAPVQTTQADSPKPFNIPAQPLGQALMAFGRQAGFQVAVDTAIVAGRNSPGVTGTMTPEEALRRLLAGTGLAYQFTSTSAVSIEAAPPGGAVVLDPISVVATPDAAGDPVAGYKADNSNTLARAPASIAETPNSISVVTQDLIRDRGAVTTDDMLETVPGVYRSFDGLSGQYDRINIRGFDTPNSFTSKLIRENGLAGGPNYPADAAIVDRLEIIRGPQSIVGGSATPGGMVNRILKSPLDTNEATVGAGADSFGKYRANADVNYVLSAEHDAALRLVLAGAGGDAFVDGEDEHHISFLPSLKADIGYDTHLKIIGNVHRGDGHSFQGLPIFADGSLPDVPASRNFKYTGSTNDVDHSGVYVEAVHDFLDDLQFTAKGGWHHGFTEEASAYGYNLQADGTASIYAARRRRESDEFTGDAFLTKSFDLSSEASTITVGADHLHSKNDYTGGYTLLGTDNIFDPSTVFEVPSGFGDTVYVDSTTILNQTGIYAQTVLRPFDRWTLMAGGRYDFVDYAVKSRLDGTNKTGHNQAFTGRIGLSYNVFDPLTFYASYSESYTPQPGFVAVGGSPLPPEEAKQYEAGVKIQAFDDKLMLGASAFRIIRKNVAATDPSNTNFSIAIGEQTHDGLEFEAVGELFPGFKLAAAHTIMDARVTESGSTSAPVGSKASFTPDHQTSVFATYEIQDGALQGLGFGGGVFHRSGIFEDTKNLQPIDGYTRFDLTVFYTGIENLDVRFNIRNILDERYIEYASNSRARERFGAPRSFLFTLSKKF